MRKILGFVLLCGFIFAMLALGNKILSHVTTGSNANIIMFSLVIVFITITKVYVNFKLGCELGKVTIFDTKSILRCLNSKLIVVYVVSYMAGGDVFFSLILNEFIYMPRYVGYLIIYAPIIIAFFLSKRKIIRKLYNTEEKHIENNKCPHSDVISRNTDECIERESNEGDKSLKSVIGLKEISLSIIMLLASAIAKFNNESKAGIAIDFAFHFFVLCFIIITCAYFKSGRQNN